MMTAALVASVTPLVAAQTWTSTTAVASPRLTIPAGTASTPAAVMDALADVVASVPPGRSAPTGRTKPRPAGYVDQAAPAKVHLPSRTLPADPITPIGPSSTMTSGKLAESTVAAGSGSIVPSPGSWSVERSIDRMVHMFALPTGPTADQYLACAGSGNDPDRGAGAAGQQFSCYRVDRTTGQTTTVPLPEDWFCSAAVHDAYGDVISAGGTAVYQRDNLKVDKTWSGLRSTYRYGSATGQITRLGDMAVPRWYPNLAKDQDNDVYVLGGQSDGKQQKTWEVMRNGSSTWQTLKFSRAMNSYADLQLIAPDTFAYTGAGGAASDKQPFVVDMNTRVTTDTPGLRDTSSRRASSGFLAYPAQDQQVLLVGGGMKSNTGSTDKMDMIDYSVWPAQVPHYVPRAPLPTPMMFVQMVNLPNGQIFATGGSAAWRTGDVLWAGFYDLASDTWQLVTPPAVGRDYHSSLWVNSDGSVSVSGGNPGRNVFHPEVETYRPWYMDRARPTIAVDSLPTIPAGETLPAAAKGSSYTVSVDLPPGAGLGSFTLDAARAATHVASDPDQGMFSVSFTTTGTGPSTRATLTVPSDTLLTPGAYRLSAVTTDGVPSRGVWLRVS